MHSAVGVYVWVVVADSSPFEDMAHPAGLADFGSFLELREIGLNF